MNKNKFNGESFNFGPSIKNSKTVRKLVEEISKSLLNFKYYVSNKKIFKEHKLLQLNCEKAKKKLNWVPKLNFNETVSYTVSWYLYDFNNKGKNMSKFSINQILSFVKNDQKH